MDEFCKKNNIDFLHIPLTHFGPFNFFISFYKLLILLITQKKLRYIFVFEGREHTISGFTKLIFPFLWKNKLLIRIRGQAQIQSKGLFSFFLYRFLTDKTVFTARGVKQRLPYVLPHEKTQVCFYGKTENIPEKTLQFYHLKKYNYDFFFNDKILTFLTLGRFDPVKGHDHLLESFMQADLQNIDSQLICIGTRQSVSAKDLFNKYKSNPHVSSSLEYDEFYAISLHGGRKKIILIEFHFKDALLFMKSASFGIIPSLGSETICRVGVEFLQAAVPVLYSEVGALSEVFCESPEFRFTAGNVQELTQRLELACKIFCNSDKFHTEKQKAYQIWKAKYQGDIYQDIILSR